MDKIQFYINHRNQREQQILETMKSQNQPWTPMELVKIIYVDTPENLYEAAAKNVRHHLEKLVKEGKVMNENDTFLLK